MTWTAPPRRPGARWVSAYAVVAISAALCRPDVAVAATPRITVAPLPTATEPAASTPTVRWRTGSRVTADLTVAAAGAAPVLVTSGTAGASRAPWIQPGIVYVFRLVRADASRRVLATLRVDVPVPRSSDGVPIPTAPAATSGAVDEVLRAVPFVVLVALGALALGVLREVRRAA